MRRGIAAAIVGILAYSGCALFPVQRQQLDLLWSRFAAVGPGRTSDFVIPTGRYTVFLRQVPEGCVRRVDMADDHHVVASGGPINVPIVQRDLTGATYHFVVQTYGGAGCGWEIQTVLNSVPEGKPPSAPQLDIPHPPAAALSSQTTDQFELFAVGVYTVHFKVGSSSCNHSYHLRLLGPGSLAQSFGGDNGGGVATGSGRFMLIPGHWRVDFGTPCSWDATVAPASEGGGGTVGF